MEIVEEFMRDMGIPKSDENLETIANNLINIGATTMFFNKGTFQALAEEWEVDPLLEHDEEPIPVPTETPEFCSDCNTPICHNGANWVCNCRRWPHGPPNLN